MSHPNNKKAQTTNPVINRQDYHLNQPCPSEEKHKKLSIKLILHKTYTNHCTNLAAAKLLQSCLTLCDPIDSSPPGSPVPGILKARILEWVAISFSNAWKWRVKVQLLSHVRLLATSWTAVYQAPPSMGFSRQKYWGGVPLPSPTIAPTLGGQKKKGRKNSALKPG